MYNTQYAIFTYFQGDVDEVRWWKVKRSPEEIKATSFEMFEGSDTGVFTDQPNLRMYLPILDCTLQGSPCEPGQQLVTGTDGAILGPTLRSLTLVPSFFDSNNNRWVPNYATEATGIAYNISFRSDPSSEIQCASTEQIFPQTCGQNYFDRRTQIFLGPNSRGASVSVGPPGQTPSVAVSLSESEPAISADMFLSDFNRDDQLRFDGFQMRLIPNSANWGGDAGRYFE
jgi:hypothetical protein